jgi:hypothetical protein
MAHLYGWNSLRVARRFTSPQLTPVVFRLDIALFYSWYIWLHKGKAETASHKLLQALAGNLKKDRKYFPT